MENKIDTIIKAFEMSKTFLNDINVNGIENCQKLVLVYNNIDVFLNMIASGEIVVDEKQEDKKTDVNK